jgi:hypothetical protein
VDFLNGAKQSLSRSKVRKPPAAFGRDPYTRLKREALFRTKYNNVLEHLPASSGHSNFLVPWKKRIEHDLATIEVEDSL